MSSSRLAGTRSRLHEATCSHCVGLRSKRQSAIQKRQSAREASERQVMRCTQSAIEGCERMPRTWGCRGRGLVHPKLPMRQAHCHCCQDPPRPHSRPRCHQELPYHSRASFLRTFSLAPRWWKVSHSSMRARGCPAIRRTSASHASGEEAVAHVRRPVVRVEAAPSDEAGHGARLLKEPHTL